MQEKRIQILRRDSDSESKRASITPTQTEVNTGWTSSCIVGVVCEKLFILWTLDTQQPDEIVYHQRGRHHRRQHIPSLFSEDNDVATPVQPTPLGQPPWQRDRDVHLSSACAVKSSSTVTSALSNVEICESECDEL